MKYNCILKIQEIANKTLCNKSKRKSVLHKTFPRYGKIFILFPEIAKMNEKMMRECEIINNNKCIPCAEIIICVLGNNLHVTL